MNHLFEFVFSFTYICLLVYCLFPLFDKIPKRITLIVMIMIGGLINNYIVYHMNFHFLVNGLLILMCNYILVCFINQKIQLYFLFYISLFHILYISLFDFIKYFLVFLTEIFYNISPIFILLCLIFLFYGIVVFLFKILNKYQIIPEKIKVRENYLYLLFLNFMALVIYLTSLHWLEQEGIMNIYVQCLLTIIVVIWLVLLYGINHIFIVNEMKTRNLFIMNIYQSVEQYRKQYQQDEEQMRKLKHDMKNHFLIIKNLKDSKEVQEYADYVYSQLENIDLKQDKISGNAYIDAIMHSKILEYPDITIHSCFRIHELKIDMIDLCPLIFNLLDNACYAANQEHGFVDIQMSYMKPHLSLIIQNTSQKDPNFTSQKGLGHGYGMKIVNDIVEKYNGSIEYNIIENQVTVKVILII